MRLFIKTLVLFFFVISLPTSVAANGTETSSLENKIYALQAKVQNENRITEYFRPGEVKSLPIGIAKDIGGVRFTVLIDSMRFTPQGAFATAYMAMELPSSSKKIALMADDIHIHESGIVAGKLKPIKDYERQMGPDKLFRISKDETYVEFDCSGYKSTKLTAEIEFSKGLFFPVDSAGKAIPNQALKTKISVDYVDANDLVVQLSLPDFGVKNLKDFSFSVTNATLDFSDTRNPQGMTFPKGYNATDLGGQVSLWRGVYVKDFDIRLPKKLSKGKKVSVGASDMILDESGVTCYLRAKHPLTLEQGSVGGWAISIDELGLQLVQNDPTMVQMKGQMDIPGLESKKHTEYTACVDMHGDYLFSVSLDQVASAGIFKGKLKLEKNSYVEIKKTKGDFEAKAVLNGTLDIDKAGEAIRVDNIQFEQLTIKNTAPKISIKYFGVEISEGKSKGFPISLTKLGVRTEKRKLALELGFDIKLSSGDKGIGGKGDINIWSKQANDSADYKFDRVELKAIGIDVDNGAFQIKGSIESFERDPIYGDGFCGSVYAKFKPGISVEANALFGKVNDLKYFYVDGLFGLNKPIPVFTGIGIYKFGGGLYRHMKQVVPSDYVYPEHMEVADTIKPGQTKSNIQYVPDASVKLGFKATVVLGTDPSPKTFNAKATFKMEFGSSGGLSYVGFEGEAKFLSEMDEELTKSPMYGKIRIDLDITNNTLFCQAVTYIDIGVIKGANENNMAGRLTMYFAPDDWYIHIGTPDERIAVEFIGLFTTDAYFMVGTQIPGFPDLPEEIKSVFKNKDMDFMRNENMLGNGSGFAFGASMEFDTGDLKFLILYGRLHLIMGFDVMLKNYGNNVRCAGRSEPLGMNGWYASGQVYTYLNAELGVRVKLFGRTKKVALAELVAAAVLQAKLPNPTFLRGDFYVRYKVLGGLVKGSCDFEFSIGEECEIVGAESPLANLNVISDLSPAEGSNEVNVFASPQAAFNMKMEDEFILLDLDNNKRKYRIKFDEMEVMDGEKAIPGELNWNEGKTVLAFRSHDILPGNKNLELKVSIHFEENINGSWKEVVENGKVVQEKKSCKFKTGEAPDYIPHENVAYSYPINRMVNFYRDEYNKGYIKLLQGQPYLFNPGKEWNQKLRFASGTQNIEVDFTYNAANRQIDFDVPSELNTSTIYAMNIVNKPVNVNTSIDKNVSDKENVVSDAQIVTTKDIGESLSYLQEKTIYESAFRTSMYTTFLNKVNSLTLEYNSSRIILDGIHRLSNKYSSLEGFDQYEISNDGTGIPLLSFESVINNNYWFNNYIKDLVYKPYQHFEKFKIDWRVTSELGLPPIRTITLYQESNISKIEDEHISADNINTSTSNIRVHWETSYYMHKDYMDLRNNAAALFLTNSSEYIIKLLNTPFMSEIANENYDFKISYRLPGLNTITTQKTLSIYYE